MQHFRPRKPRDVKVAWLDLVHDPALIAVFKDLLLQFEQERYRPEALAALVTPDAAQTRWRSLRLFTEKTGHLLVTNGPYRLKEFTRESIVLEAVRDLTYPLGFGTFDRFVNPPKAVFREVTQDGGKIVVRADAEMVLKMGRNYGLVKEPLSRTTTRGIYGLLVVSRYLLIGADGKVLKLDKMDWMDDGHFVIELPKNLKSGEYTVVLGIFLDGNTLEAPATTLRFRVGGGTSPG